MADDNFKVGVLGLGIIGEIWAGHLNDAGMLTGCWNRTPKPDAPCWMGSPAEVAKAADVLFIVVADPAAVHQVMDAIELHLGPQHTIIQSSTIDPDSSARFKQRAEAKGARYLEAPFTGSKPAAQAKKTVFYLGGPESLIEELQPVLSVFSEHRLRIGDHRQACTLKLAMNMQIALQAEALSESIHFAREAGISDGVFFNCLSRNVARSGLTDLKEAKLKDGDFSPQFSIKHMHKDMRLALKSGGEDKMPATAAVRKCFEKAEALGCGDEDFIALYKALDS